MDNSRLYLWQCDTRLANTLHCDHRGRLAFVSYVQREKLWCHSCVWHTPIVPVLRCQSPLFVVLFVGTSLQRTMLLPFIMYCAWLFAKLFPSRIFSSQNNGLEVLSCKVAPFLCHAQLWSFLILHIYYSDNTCNLILACWLIQWRLLM